MGHYWNTVAAMVLLAMVGMVLSGDMMRKSIVFDLQLPDVFYCPQEKPTSFEKMIVKSKPLEKLCEFNGKGLPRDYKSDCYNDVDESDFACAEKKRILVKHSDHVKLLYCKPQLISEQNPNADIESRAGSMIIGLLEKGQDIDTTLVL